MNLARKQSAGRVAAIQFVLELSTRTGVNVPIGSIICHTHRLQKTGDITMGK